jgi:TMEM175 potassium channel family protein
VGECSPECPDHVTHVRNVLGRAARQPGALANSRRVSKGRLEAFSDGVLAVAITLLVLDLKVPHPPLHHTLGHELANNWPNYAAYVTSFVTIGIIWINHHAMIARLREPDHAILMLNLLLLMSIGVLPFATSLFATYLNEGHGQNLAAAIYGGSLLVMSILFAYLNRHIMFPKSHLLNVHMSLELRRRVLTRGVLGLIPYALATALAFVSPYITLGICAVVAGFYALPIASTSER